MKSTKTPLPRRAPARRHPNSMEVLARFNTLSAFVIGVLIVWGLIFGVGYVINGPTPDHPLLNVFGLNVFGGFMLGMLAMCIASRVYPTTTQHH